MFNRDVLDIDCKQEVEKICENMRNAIFTTLERRGAVVALSGDVDSSVTATLTVKALGKEKVFGLLLPEHDSSSKSLELGQLMAQLLDIEHRIEKIGHILESIGCYRWRDDAIRSIFPDYSEGWKNRINISQNLLEGDLDNFFTLVVQSPDGYQQEKPLPLEAYRQIVAATSFKQRLRKTIEYFHADRLNYAVIGTMNRLEYNQGFFVKNGNASADVKPIAHLYKTQVYAIARHLGLPEEICKMKSATDTYSLPQGQEELYFMLPYDQLDLALYALNHNIPVEEAAPVIGLTPEQITRVYNDIRMKRRTTHHSYSHPILFGDVPEIMH